jgi:hypothetical protein
MGSIGFPFPFKLLLISRGSQPTKVKVVGTFHVPSTWNPCKSLTANGTVERACTFCRLCLAGNPQIVGIIRGFTILTSAIHSGQSLR